MPCFAFFFFFWSPFLHFKFRITKNTILFWTASFYVAVNLYLKLCLLPCSLERATGTYPEPLVPTTYPHTLFHLTSHLCLCLLFIPSTLNNQNSTGWSKVYVHLMITVPKLSVFEQSPQNWWFEDCHHRMHSECVPCYTEHGLREQFGVSINVWRMAGDTLNITCNFLYCNHYVHRDFLITFPFSSMHATCPLLFFV
jgi:hypothetical protein